MAKPQRSYACNTCGSITSKWAGKCESCGEWNSISEETVEAGPPKGLSSGGSRSKGRVIEFVPLSSGEKTIYPRLTSGIKEFDRTCGGGLVPGSATLIGGDPGIGKSTLLLQVVCALASPPTPPASGGEERPVRRSLGEGGSGGGEGPRVLYISGEEAVDQVRMRAARLGLEKAPALLASATNVRDIVASMEDRDARPALVIVDSIQTMYIDHIDSAPGTVTQVRTSAQEIIRSAKAHGIAVIFVGHVTKDGQIAGPRVLEHMVDTVLYFEGDRSHQFRILRSVKNRFGPTDEIGVFEMAHQGLVEVENPSALFLSQRHQNVAGSAILAALEGTRPLLVEVQALVAPSSLAAPRRAVLGWDPNRLAMIAAVLEARCGIRLSGHDIFLNIAGGIRISEPAADVAVAAALISALNNVCLPPEAVFFGEIGLAGEIRQVAQPDLRLKEASKLGFTQGFIPQMKKKGEAPLKNFEGMSLKTVQHIHDLAGLLS